MVKELIRNGGFERGNLDFWEEYLASTTLETGEVHRGSYSVKLTVPAVLSAAILQKDYQEVFEHEIYKVAAWLKNVDATYISVYAIFYDVDMVHIEDLEILKKAGVFDWTLLTDVFNIPSEASYMRFMVFIVGGAVEQYGYLDSFSMQRLDMEKVTSIYKLLATVTNLTTKATYYGSEFFTGIWKQAEYHLYCTSLTGTSPTLDVTIQGYDPNTEQWKDIMVFQQLDAAGGEFKTLLSNLGWKQRVKYVLAGTTVTDCDFKEGVVYKR